MLLYNDTIYIYIWITVATGLVTSCALVVDMVPYKWIVVSSRRQATNISHQNILCDQTRLSATQHSNWPNKFSK
jgi:hypothetical protein